MLTNKSFFHPPPRSDWERETTARILTSSRVPWKPQHQWRKQELTAGRRPLAGPERPGGCGRGPGSASALPPVPFRELHSRPASSFSQNETKKEGRPAGPAQARRGLRSGRDRMRFDPNTATTSTLDPTPSLYADPTNDTDPTQTPALACRPVRSPILVVLVEVLV